MKFNLLRQFTNRKEIIFLVLPFGCFIERTRKSHVATELQSSTLERVAAKRVRGQSSDFKHLLIGQIRGRVLQ